MTSDNDARLMAPAAARNKEPILHALRQLVPTHGTVLEVASGTGEHIAYFAKHLPQCIWQPSEIDDSKFNSICAWREFEKVSERVEPDPVIFDAMTGSSEMTRLKPSVIFTANMIHIAPWEACCGLFDFAGAGIAPAGKLVLYGPFGFPGEGMAESNRQFDANLRQRNPRWGVRNLEDIERVASLAGLNLVDKHQMPVNNFILVFQK